MDERDRSLLRRILATPGRLPPKERGEIIRDVLWPIPLLQIRFGSGGYRTSEIVAFMSFREAEDYLTAFIERVFQVTGRKLARDMFNIEANSIPGCEIDNVAHRYINRFMGWVECPACEVLQDPDEGWAGPYCMKCIVAGNAPEPLPFYTPEIDSDDDIEVTEVLTRDYMHRPGGGNCTCGHARVDHPRNNVSHDVCSYCPCIVFDLANDQRLACSGCGGVECPETGCHHGLRSG